LVKREFVLSAGNRDELKDWLAFLEYDEVTKSDGWTRTDDWKEADTANFSSEYATLKAKLKLDGSIMIRDVGNIYDGLKDGEKVPDYKHISSGGNPVILGTSWAGAFRSGLYRLLKQKFPERTEAYINDVFGNVTEAKGGTEADASVSRVIFGASFLEELAGKEDGYRNITRVKIDRFTGGAANGALFNEKPWFGGETTLEIRYKKERNDVKELLLLGLDGIDKGLIQIGGESAVGRGFFKVTGVTVDGAETEIDKPKDELRKAIRKAGESI
jgi:hypothetical protein